MATIPLKKSISRSPLRLGFLLIPLALACFALTPFVQSAQAVGPEPNEGDLIGNMAEDDNAVPDLASATQEAATGQAANNPNQRVIKIDPRGCQCVGSSGERVNLRGEFQISFKVGEFQGVRGVVPDLPIKLLKGFKGDCPNTEKCLVGIGTKTGREYVADKRLKPLLGASKDEDKWTLHSMNGMGDGQFLVGVLIYGHPNPPPNAEANPGRVVKWTLIYKIQYKWDRDKKVTNFKVILRDVCGHP
jgi:hypothetical protein